MYFLFYLLLSTKNINPCNFSLCIPEAFIDNKFCCCFYVFLLVWLIFVSSGNLPKASNFYSVSQAVNIDSCVLLWLWNFSKTASVEQHNLRCKRYPIGNIELTFLWKQITVLSLFHQCWDRRKSEIKIVNVLLWIDILISWENQAFTAKGS